MNYKNITYKELDDTCWDSETGVLLLRNGELLTWQCTKSLRVWGIFMELISPTQIRILRIFNNTNIPAEVTAYYIEPQSIDLKIKSKELQKHWNSHIDLLNINLEKNSISTCRWS